MLKHTIKIDDTDYRYLEQAALLLEISVKDMLSKIIEKQRLTDKQKSDKLGKSKSVYDKQRRWAEISHRIRRDPPLRGAGAFVRKCGEEFRDDFSLKHDVE